MRHRLHTAPALLLLLLASGAWAQPVRVVSEFLRFTPAGQAFPQDRAEFPVEVLSPPLVPGVWNSFRIVVDVDPGNTFRLYVAQNPANAMQVRAFRETVERGAAGWQISRREAIQLPFASSQIPAGERRPDRGNYTFWFEIRPPVDYPSRRLKLEAQLLLDNQWFVYPLELRVLDLEVAGRPRDPEKPPTATLQAQTADLPYREAVKQFLCGSPVPVPAPDAPLERHAAHIFRLTVNAVSESASRDEVVETMLGFLDTPDAEPWCKAPVYPFERYGAEWPAVLRNRVVRLTGDPD